MKAKISSPEAVKLLLEGSLTLAQIEQNGIRVDTDYLHKTMDTLSKRIREKETKLRQDEVYNRWRRVYGQKTNLDAPEQLGKVLFDVLKFPYPADELTQTGKYQTDEAVLSKVDHPFVKEYLYTKKLKKVNGTFLKGIRDETIDGYLHPFFNLHKVVTFRSSSDSPNFQNFPKRNPEMYELVRRCFIPRSKGRILGEVDFAGIEVRVACCYTKDPQLIKEFTGPDSDPHGDTARQLFFLTKEQVDKKTTRDWAKNRYVFPEFYGSVYFQCAPHIWEAIEAGAKLPNSDVTIKEHLKSHGIKRLGKCNPQEKPKPGTFEYHVKTVEYSFWNDRFKVFTKWKKDWWNAYLNEGGFRTYTGFYIQGNYKRNEVLNFAIQGSAFHLLLWSLIQIQKWLRKYKMKTKLIGQVHDSMVLDIHPDELKTVIDKIKEIIAVDLLKHWKWIIVPMNVEVELAPPNGSWHEIVKVDL